MSQWLKDTFTGAPGKNILADAYAGEIGAAAWVAASGYGAIIDDTGGRVYCQTTAGVKMYPPSAASTDNEYVEIKFDVLSAQGLVLFIRGNANLTVSYHVVINRANTSLVINRESGSYQAVGTAKAISLLPTGNVLRLKASGTGATVTLEVTLNGTTWTEADTASNRIVTPGKTGIEFTLNPDGTTAAGSNTTGIHVSQIDGFDAAAADTVAPNLSSPTATAASSTTITATVSTDEANGTLYCLATHTTNPSAAQVKLGVSQAVSSTGVKTFNLTGADPGPGSTYNVYFLHRDAVGNESAIVGATGIAMPVPPDTTAPVTVSAAIANAAPNVIVLTVSEPLGASVPPAAAFTPSGGKTATAVAVNGSQISVTVNTPYANGDVVTLGYTQPAADPRIKDAAGNPMPSFTGLAVANNIAGVPQFLTDEMASSGTLRTNQAFVYTCCSGGAIGVGLGTVTHGTGTTTPGGRALIKGMSAGPLMVWVEFADGGTFYQKGAAA